MRLNLRRLLILLLILLLSVGFGFLFDAIATAIEKSNHPRPEAFAKEIEESAREFAVPEAILWSVIKAESDFVSSQKGENGGIGLFQITPDRFAWIRQEILKADPLDSGMLYDPATNLQSGAAYLSHLYRRYGVWETVFAAWCAGETVVDAWLRDPAYTDDGGRLHTIPDPETCAFAKEVESAVKLYTKLYY